MTLDEALGLPVADHPVEEVQGVLLVDGVSGDSEPIDDHRHGRKHHSGGNGEVEISGERQEGATNSCSNQGQVPSDTESPVEVGGDAGVDGLIQVNLVLVHLAHFLLALEHLQGEEFGVIVLGVGQGLSEKGRTSKPRWMRWRR